MYLLMTTSGPHRMSYNLFILSSIEFLKMMRWKDPRQNVLSYDYQKEEG